MMGLPRCMTFGGPRVDAAIAKELLRAVEPMAIEAALEAERMHQERQDDQQRILDLELQQARYEAISPNVAMLPVIPIIASSLFNLRRTGKRRFAVSRICKPAS